MVDDSVEKRVIGDLHYNDKVVIDCGLSNYLDKREGGEVSGDINIVQGILYTNRICGIQYDEYGNERTDYTNSVGSRSIVIGAKNIGTGYDQAIFGQANVL